MIQAHGILDKMRTTGTAPIVYTLTLGTHEIVMNDLIGKHVTLRFLNQINCTNCGKVTPKSYQGFCFQCFSEAPDNAECILRPELCKGHLGLGRDADWEFTHHVQPHYVYLALSSAAKIGVTRSTQVPTRWIDQGASAAIIIAKVPYRKLAGDIEVSLKAHYTDKTNWQQMLKNVVNTAISLVDEKQRALSLLPAHLQTYAYADNTIHSLDYPVTAYPEKISSISLDKTAAITDTLMGIKGQYLIFKDAGVINIRSHAGYNVALES